MCLLYTNQLPPHATLVVDLTLCSAHIPASGISAHESSVMFIHFTMRHLWFPVFISPSILESFLVLATHLPPHLYNFDRFKTSLLDILFRSLPGTGEYLLTFNFYTSASVTFCITSQIIHSHAHNICPVVSFFFLKSLLPSYLLFQFLDCYVPQFISSHVFSAFKVFLTIHPYLTQRDYFSRY